MLNIEMLLTNIYIGIAFVYVVLFIEEKILNKEKSIKIVRNRFEKILMILGMIVIILETINKNVRLSVITIILLITIVNIRRKIKKK